MNFLKLNNSRWNGLLQDSQPISGPAVGENKASKLLEASFYNQIRMLNLNELIILAASVRTEEDEDDYIVKLQTSDSDKKCFYHRFYNDF